MKIVVLGTGYVAQAYLRATSSLGYHPLVLSRAWLDYTNKDTLSLVLLSYKPDIVINCTGYTGTTVDDCQNNKHECYHANVSLAYDIACLCAQFDVPLIHISSGCIFNGPGPFTETDEPNFAHTGSQFYAITKHLAEKSVHKAWSRTWIFRIRMPFGGFHHPRNLLIKLSTYPRILDGINSITHLDEFAMRSWQLWQKAPPGIYHAAQPNPITNLTIAQMLLDAGLRKLPIELYDPAEFLLDHCPRSTTVLSVNKFNDAYGDPFTSTKCALEYSIESLLTGRTY